MKSKTLRIVIFSIFVVIIIGMTIYFAPYIFSLKDEQVRLELKNKIASLGFWGWFVMVMIQTAQVVIAFLPGEPVEIVMGIMYGPIIGTLSCFLGIILGTLIIFALARLIGKPFISLFIDVDKLNNYRFLNSKAKKDTIIFTLFFIPGTPKDLLTYFAPFLKMNIFRFIIISLFARIPSVITSTISGASISSGNWKLTIIMFVSTFIVAIIGLYINKLYMKKHNDKYEEKTNIKNLEN
jgi:uncharacterized membrane protein YdjX (TVP38/TMEM64 family)